MNSTTQDANQPGRIRAALTFLGPYFTLYRKQLLLGIAAMLLVDVMQLTVPRVIKSAVDGISAGSITSLSLLNHGYIILGLAIGVGIFRFIWRYLIIGFSRLLERDIRNQLFSHILTMDKAFFQRNPAGKLMALSTNDLTAIQLACGMGLVAFIDAFVMLAAGLTFMIYIHPGLTFLAILPMPFLALITKLLSKKLHSHFAKVQEQFSQITEFARTAITSIRLLKIYNQEKRQHKYFNRLGLQYVDNNIKVARIQGALFPISTLIANVSFLLVVFFGGRLTIREVITIGDFVAFISYLFMLTWPMMAIGWVANLFQRGITSLERIKKVLEQQPDLQSRKSQKTISFQGEINIQNLTFSYPSADSPPVLHDISLKIKLGLLGIVGPTGSGKSTLCDLLAGLYQVDDNSIYFNNVDVNQIPLSTVRNMVSFVPQNTQLFSDTIAFNIALAKPDASNDEIEHAARLAVIHDEINQFPEGYKTRIGEKGVKLSGGQRQRIALARALLAEKPIMIIDDALSAVDVDTEAKILANIKHILEEKTVIFTSHRLALLKNACQIAVLENGRVAALGSREELLASNDFFKTIYTYQAAKNGSEKYSNKEGQRL